MFSRCAVALLLWAFLVRLPGVSGQRSVVATVRSEDARAHVGESANVCGVVASARFAVSTRGQLGRRVIRGRVALRGWRSKPVATVSDFLTVGS